MSSIKQLLNKKGWTGEEVGKAFIASLIDDIKHIGEQHTPLFSQEELKKMVNSLTDREKNIYFFYQDLCGSIAHTYDFTQAQYQQFYNGFYRCLYNLRQCQIADETKRLLDAAPLIMTQSQYDKEKSEAEAREKSFKTSVYGIMMSLIAYYIEDEDAPKDIRKAIDETDNEPATNPVMLSTYNERYGQGYYTLEDGRRSDQMSEEEWQQALEETGAAQAFYWDKNPDALMTSYKLFFEGIGKFKEAYKKKFGEALTEERATTLFKEMETITRYRTPHLLFDTGFEKGRIQKGECPLKNLNDIYCLLQLVGISVEAKVEWHYYTEPPTDLTKYDLLLDEAYEDLKGDGKEFLKYFKEDYPKLYKTLEAFIKEHIPTAKDIKPTQYTKDLISWGELAENHIGKYQRMVTADEWSIRGNWDEDETAQAQSKRNKSWYGGIAILQNPSKGQVDENGNYIDEEIYNSLCVHDIERLYNSSIRIEQEADYNRLLIPALSFLTAYNTLIDIIQELYHIKDLEEVKIDLSAINNQINAYNDFLYTFYSFVYGSGEEIERKRDLIKEVFKPIPLEEITPTETAIEKVKSVFAGISKSSGDTDKIKNLSPFITTLQERGLNI